jgi:hypothetical protein
MSQYMEDSECVIVNDTDPPKSTYMRVRCVREYGGLQTDSGRVDLLAQCEYYLRKADCDQLIKQGFVEVAND